MNKRKLKRINSFKQYIYDKFFSNKDLNENVIGGLVEISCDCKPDVLYIEKSIVPCFYNEEFLDSFNGYHCNFIPFNDDDNKHIILKIITPENEYIVKNWRIFFNVTNLYNVWQYMPILCSIDTTLCHKQSNQITVVNYAPTHCEIENHFNNNNIFLENKEEEKEQDNYSHIQYYYFTNDFIDDIPFCDLLIVFDLLSNICIDHVHSIKDTITQLSNRCNYLVLMDNFSLDNDILSINVNKNIVFLNDYALLNYQYNNVQYEIYLYKPNIYRECFNFYGQNIQILANIIQSNFDMCYFTTHRIENKSFHDIRPINIGSNNNTTTTHIITVNVLKELDNNKDSLLKISNGNNCIMKHVFITIE